MRSARPITRQGPSYIFREKLVLDWRKTQARRAAVRVVIEDKLDELPEMFTKDIYRNKCDAIYKETALVFFSVSR